MCSLGLLALVCERQRATMGKHGCMSFVLLIKTTVVRICFIHLAKEWSPPPFIQVKRGIFNKEIVSVLHRYPYFATLQYDESCSWNKSKLPTCFVHGQECWREFFTLKNCWRVWDCFHTTTDPSDRIWTACYWCCEVKRFMLCSQMCCGTRSNVKISYSRGRKKW